jgi:endo-chitodextinase
MSFTPTIIRKDSDCLLVFIRCMIISKAAHSIGWLLTATACVLLVLCSQIAQAQTAKPMSVLLGSKGEGTTTDTITDTTGSYINANRFQAQASGNTKRINAKINAIQGKYQVALYTDRNGQPNRLIATSSEVSPKTNGWHNFPLATQASLTKGRSYWIAIWSNDTNARVYASNNGVLRWNNIPYSPKWPTSLSLPTAGNYTYSMYAESSGGAAAIAPIVKLTAPLDDASYTAGSNINIAATATDSDGNIAKVEFFASSGINTTTNTKLGEKTQAPWTMMWTNVAAGNYAITAKATDSQGLMSTSEPADIIVNVAPPPPPPPAVNQAPIANLVSPAVGTSVTVGTTINITATATDADGTVAKVEFFTSINGSATKLGEDLISPYTIAWTPLIAGTYALTAKATDDKGVATTSGATSVAVTAAVVPPPPPPTGASDRPQTKFEAARFLTQATFGPKQSEIDQLMSSSFSAWLEREFAKPTASHNQTVTKLVNAYYRGDFGSGEHANVESIYLQGARGDDQLRQRVAWALSQIMVIGDSATPRTSSVGPHYLDTLNKHAFGSYRQLLEDITLSTAMGLYLSHIGNEKEDPATGRLPDENYAREIMQLFTIGLWQLNQDGTQKKNAAGNPIPTYGQDDIRGLAKVFTGFTYSRCLNIASPTNCIYGSRLGWAPEPTIVAVAQFHSVSEKSFLGITLAANRTANADLKDALDTLFNHPNVGPFIGKQLIQRFVTSNPSAEYVGRVSAAFNNNGIGIRGDMKAVLRAIFLDAEARDMGKIANDPRFGKLREPIVRWLQFLRVFTKVSNDNRAYYELNRMRPAFGQWPLSAPSIFNFYRPTYSPPGALKAAGMVAPEFQITHEYTIAATHNEFHLWTSWDSKGLYGEHADDYGWLINVAGDAAKLVDTLDGLLTYGTLHPVSRAAMVAAINTVPEYEGNKGRAKMALKLFFSSPDYLIQK